jgi:hypothetical protein
VLVLFAVLIIAALFGSAVGVAVRRWPVADVAQSVTGAIGREVRRRGGLAWFIRARVDPATATGLALTIALRSS